MAIGYKTWLARTGRKPTAKNAALWKKTHGVALGKYNSSGQPTGAQPAPPPPPPPAPAPPPPPPAFDPNFRDAQSIKELSDLASQRDLLKANATRAYELGIAELDAAKPGIERDRTLGLDSANNNAAARGMFRSGNRIVNRGKVNTEYGDRMAANQRQRDSVAFERDRINSQADQDYLTGSTGVYSSAGQRRLAEYRRQWGV